MEITRKVKKNPKRFLGYFVGLKESRKIPARFPARFPSPKSKKITDNLLQERRKNLSPKKQDTFDPDKGQESAISGLRLHWIF